MCHNGRTGISVTSIVFIYITYIMYYIYLSHYYPCYFSNYYILETKKICSATRTLLNDVYQNTIFMILSVSFPLTVTACLVLLYFTLLHSQVLHFFTDERFVAVLFQANLLVSFFWQHLFSSCFCFTFW